MVLGQIQMLQSLSDVPVIDGLNGKALRGALTKSDDVFTRGLHQHPHGEIFLLQSGHLKSQSPNGCWLIPAGHLCWVPPFTEHGADTDNTQGVRIYLARQFCGVLPSDPCVMRTTALIAAVVDRLAAFSISQAAPTEAEKRLLGVLCDEIDRAKSTPILLSMPQDVRLRRMAEKLLNSPNSQGDLDVFAVEAGMSRRGLTRNFKLETGLPIGEWRQIARLMHGIDMLAAGKSVTETAFALGYNSISSFVALCQRHTGMSPKLLSREITNGRAVAICFVNQ